ncbi:MAG: hypothetical protein AAF557_15355 [Pseudomonadota bacterium]
MNTTEYAPMVPAYTRAFKDALEAKHEAISELLIGAEALQELTFQTITRTGKQCCELPFGDWEIALGQGSSGAELAARMAGYTCSPDGRWSSGEEVSPVMLRVPRDLLGTFLRSWADVIS